jgi:hypothetical protein
MRLFGNLTETEDDSMIDFLSGAVTMAFLLIGVCFLKCWKRTRDRLFVFFAVSFGLFAVNQIALTLAHTPEERSGYIYILRILGYCTILFAIVDKNTSATKKPR